MPQGRSQCAETDRRGCRNRRSIRPPRSRFSVSESDTIPVPIAFRRVLVRGPSMVPTLRDGDQVLVRLDPPRVAPGDVVVVALPDRPLSVKRLLRRQPDGTVWVEGDNPFGSTDSRDLGALPPDAVTGRVLLRLWPRPGRIPARPAIRG